MSEFAGLTKQGYIGVITIDNPPVNALGLGVRKGILSCLEEASKDDDIKAIVLTCAGRTFIAGADISEFDKPMEEPGLLAPLDALESSSKPVIAAIHGTALGGGLEVALACHYRCAVASAQVGFPEVLLGLIPGAAGTQRLPRVVGPEQALAMITSGIPITAGKANELGLIDHIVDGDLLEGAVAFAGEIVAENRGLVKVRDMNDKVTDVNPEIFSAARAKFAKSKRNFNAPQRCIDAIEAACTLPFDEGLKKESEMFAQLVTSAQSAAQRHIFFAERAAAKISDVPKNTPLKEIGSVGIIGAGTMGGGISMNFASAGIPVKIFDTNAEGLERGMGIIKKNYENTMNRGKLTQAQVDSAVALITPVSSYDDFADVDMIVEAVFEDMDVKKEVFRELDKVCKDECILATNTSTLDINVIAAETKRPEWVIGMHFFSPANIMKLLEVVRGDKTNAVTLATTMAIAKKIKKVGVVVGVCDGFVGNRMMHPYRADAIFLAEEGASPQQIDSAIYSWGMAMGPMAMNDLAGLDISWAIRKGKPKPEGLRYSEIPDRICEMGRFGQKTSAGWYQYEEGSRTPLPDPEIQKLIADAAKEAGIEQREITDEEVVERTIYAMINMGARVLEEGFAQRASDIDVIFVNGYGFPIYRGGPMFYADTVGLKTVYDKICEFNDRESDNRWEPAPLLKKLAEEGGTFN